MEHNVEKILKVNIESRYSNDLNPVDPMFLTFRKISFWEYGFNLVPNSGEEIYSIQMEVYQTKENSLLVKLCSSENDSSYFAINKRGEAEVNFGYNSLGDKIIIKNDGNKPFDFNQTNKVHIISLDGEHDNLKYYWGRKGNDVKGYLDEQKKTFFYIYIQK
jgi:hypothetical protein